MPFTQIVSVKKNEKAVKDSLKKVSTEKLVFLLTSENAEHTIKLRNKLALELSVPTEVRAVNGSGVINIVTSYENPVIHLADHLSINYLLLSTAFVTGVPVLYFNNGKVESLPTPSAPLKSMLSDTQIRILEELLESPLSVKELCMKLKITESMLFSHLYGTGVFKGLIRLGLVKDNDLIELTELGRLVAHS